MPANNIKRKGEIHLSDITTLRVQKETKPKIEDVLPYSLEGGMRELAQGFVAHLRANRMTPSWGGVHNTWKANFKGKLICSIRMGAGWWNDRKNARLAITPYLNHLGAYEGSIMDEGMRDCVWANLFDCEGCHPPPCVAKTITILGRQFDSICGGRPPVWFFDPDEAAIGCIQRLLEFEKQARV